MLQSCTQLPAILFRHRAAAARQRRRFFEAVGLPELLSIDAALETNIQVPDILNPYVLQYKYSRF